MKQWYLVETESYTARSGYHVPEICCSIGRLIGFALMFGGGFVIGQVIRGLIEGVLMLLGIL